MTRRRQVALVACLLLVGSGATVAATAAQADGATITAVEYTGQGDLALGDGRLHVWRAASHEFTVTVDSTDRIDSGRLCLVALTGEGGETRLGCRPVSVPAGSVEPVAVTVDTWPGNATGRVLVQARLLDSSGAVLAQDERPATVLRRAGDRDTDGLTNEREVSVGTSPLSADTDDDGLDDREEVDIYGTEPRTPDTDSDGLTDGAEVRTHRTDPTVADTDGDGLADSDEVRAYGTDPNRADTDGDRLVDGAEVNTYQTNATAADTDGDGLGDGAEVEELDTDPTGSDTDGDGLGDGVEQTIHLTDPTTVDTDGDGLGDDAEVRTYRTDPTASDTDGDGLGDGTEVEQHGTDPNAADTDSDGLPDRVEVRRGTDPTAPTAGSVGPVTALVGFLSRRPALALGGVVAAGAALGAVAYRTDAGATLAAVGGRFGRDEGGDAGGDGTGARATATGPEGATDGGAAAQEPTDTPSDGTGTAPEPTVTGAPADGAADDESTVGEDDQTAPTADPSVMTNEERVRHLLSTNGGRMLQSDMVETSDWSKATVSRVLSEMEEQGAVTRVDIGKGNLVTLPGEAPENATSGFTEE